MKLYHSPASPFVRKVMMVLHVTGLIDQVEIVPAKGTAIDPGTMPVAQNPLGKIPALTREDGPAIYDSRVICRYLDEITQAGLYPEGPGLWDVLTIEATADGILDAAVLMVYEGRVRPEEIRYAPWVEAQWGKVSRALAAIEARWMSHLQGPDSMAQIAVAAALGYVDFRHPDRDWRCACPALAAWYETYAQRPEMQATIPAG